MSPNLRTQTPRKAKLAWPYLVHTLVACGGRVRVVACSGRPAHPPCRSHKPTWPPSLQGGRSLVAVLNTSASTRSELDAQRLPRIDLGSEPLNFRWFGGSVRHPPTASFRVFSILFVKLWPTRAARGRLRGALRLFLRLFLLGQGRGQQAGQVRAPPPRARRRIVPRRVR